MNEIILSILIPTYNRDTYLKKLLEEIFTQILNEKMEKKIEIMVSDNCSTDETKKVMEKFKFLNINYKYWTNDKNLGADGNFLKLIKEGNGIFCWILGDDEILKKNSLKKIVNILEINKDIGHLFISNEEKENLEIKFKNYQKFLKKINYKISFISANIFNKNYIDLKIDYEKFIGSHLIQEYFYLQAIMKKNKNIFFRAHIFDIGHAENVGGYKFFKVFGKNQNEIFNFFQVQGLSQKSINYINQKLLREFFPFYILQYRKNIMKNKWETEDIRKELEEIFSTKINYWLFCYPMIKFSLSKAELYFVFIRIFNKILRNLSL